MWSGGLEKMGIFPCLGSQLSRQYLLSTAPPPAQKVEIPMVFTLGEQAGLGSARLLCQCAVQTLSPVRLFVTPWTAALQASLSFPISWSVLRLKCIESVTPSNHLVLCRPLLLSSPSSVFHLSSESVKRVLAGLTISQCGGEGRHLVVAEEYLQTFRGDFLRIPGKG